MGRPVEASSWRRRAPGGCARVCVFLGAWPPPSLCVPVFSLLARAATVRPVSHGSLSPAHTADSRPPPLAAVAQQRARGATHIARAAHTRAHASPPGRRPGGAGGAGAVGGYWRCVIRQRRGGDGGERGGTEGRRPIFSGRARRGVRWLAWPDYPPGVCMRGQRRRIGVQRDRYAPARPRRRGIHSPPPGPATAAAAAPGLSGLAPVRPPLPSPPRPPHTPTPSLFPPQSQPRRQAPLTSRPRAAVRRSPPRPATPRRPPKRPTCCG